MLDQELTTKTAKIGDTFSVTVLHNVTAGDTIVIPQGAVGQGEITFSAGKGGFGRAGMMMIALRTLELGEKKVLLDGRYREEGSNNNAATVATWVAVGVFSGFIQGKTGIIPKGRELKARTGEDIAYVPGAPPPPIPAPQAAPPVDAPAASPENPAPPAPAAEQPAAPATTAETPPG